MDSEEMSRKERQLDGLGFDLRRISGSKSLFTCHSINKKKPSCFFENTSIILQRAGGK